jgi:hypothetical protein
MLPIPAMSMRLEFMGLTTAQLQDSLWPTRSKASFKGTCKRDQTAQSRDRHPIGRLQQRGLVAQADLFFPYLELCIDLMRVRHAME